MEKEKIYILTSGKYSEYTIEKVFKTKEMAQRYMDNYSGYNCDEMEIEEYYFEDEEVEKMEIFEYVEARFKHNYISNETFFEFEILKSNSLYDDNIDNINNISIFDFKSSHFNFHEINIRITKNINQINYNKEKLKEKFNKIMLDMFAEIKSLKEIEQWTDEMIKEYFIEKYLKNINI